MKKLFASVALGAILTTSGAFAYGGGARTGEGASRQAAQPSQTQASGAARDRTFREADAVGHYNGPRNPFLKRYTYD